MEGCMLFFKNQGNSKDLNVEYYNYNDFMKKFLNMRENFIFMDKMANKVHLDYKVKNVMGRLSKLHFTAIMPLKNSFNSNFDSNVATSILNFLTGVFKDIDNSYENITNTNIKGFLFSSDKVIPEHSQFIVYDSFREIMLEISVVARDNLLLDLIDMIKSDNHNVYTINIRRIDDVVGMDRIEVLKNLLNDLREATFNLILQNGITENKRIMKFTFAVDKIYLHTKYIPSIYKARLRKLGV